LSGCEKAEHNVNISEITAKKKLRVLRVQVAETLSFKTKKTNADYLVVGYANFEIDFEKDNVVFNVKGYGHGVGMSQWGAEGMAKEGFLCYDILKHYYTGVDIKDLY
jgi:SpoIID/LytB domain protein